MTTTRHIPTVGDFTQHSDYWDATPDALGGSYMSIESPVIDAAHQDRATKVCSDWPGIVAQCLAYVQSQRSRYGLRARSFANPKVFIRSGDEWSVYFKTRQVREAVVAVEFRGDVPLQLVIGD